MTGSLVPTRPPAETTAAVGPRRNWTPWLLVAGWAAQVCLRLVFFRNQNVPMLYPDEVGYLLGARWLTGGYGGDLSGVAFYQGGYALLLIPAFLIGGDLQDVYRIALSTNALVGALAFPLGYLLLRRCGLPALQAGPLAWAAAVLPATTLFGEAAWADAVLPVLVLGWLLALDRFVRRPSAGIGTVAALAAAYAFATHSRGTVVLIVHAAVVTALLVRTRSRAAAVTAAVTVAGGAAAAILNARLVKELYPSGPIDLAGNVADRVTSLDGQMWSLSGGIGQIWAMTAGTWGLGALGLVAVLTALLRRDTAAQNRIMCGVLLAVTAGLAYGSTAALPDEQRVGNLAYGRYISCVALPYLLIGLVTLLRSDRVARQIGMAGALFVAAACWFRLYSGDRLRTDEYLGWDFPEAGLLGGSYDRPRVFVTTAVAFTLLLGFWALRRWGTPKLFGGLIAVNLFATTLMIAILIPPRSKPLTPLPGPRTGGVAIDRQLLTDHGDPSLVVSRIALRVDWTRHEWFEARNGPPRPGVCKTILTLPSNGRADQSWPAHPPGWLFEVNGSPKSVQWVTWYNPNCL